MVVESGWHSRQRPCKTCSLLIGMRVRSSIWYVYVPHFEHWPTLVRDFQKSYIVIWWIHSSLCCDIASSDIRSSSSLLILIYLIRPHKCIITASWNVLLIKPSSKTTPLCNPIPRTNDQTFMKPNETFVLCPIHTFMQPNKTFVPHKYITSNGSSNKLKTMNR